MKVLFITFGGINKPSSRFRVHQLLEYRKETGDLEYRIISQPQKGSVRQYPRFLRGVVHSLEMIKFYISITFIVFKWAEKIFIQKTILPKIVIRMFKASKRSFLFDFDDAIYVSFSTSKQRKRRDKLASLAYMLKNAETVIAGNQVLWRYARKFTDKCEVIPTVVDTQKYCVQNNNKEFNFVIGWIGTSQNLVFLEQIAPAIKTLCREFPQLRLLVICDKPYVLGDMVINKPWSKETEISNMLEMDIGVMPLPDDEWTRGKCSFKALQYLALGIPVVISPVGMNNEVITDGVNGYLANESDEWVGKLRSLIMNQNIRQEMAMRGRKLVEEKYSLEVWLKLWHQTITKDESVKHFV